MFRLSMLVGLIAGMLAVAAPGAVCPAFWIACLIDCGIEAELMLDSLERLGELRGSFS